MKNPLNKRIPKELAGDFGKYIVIFLFMVLLIGLVSAFKVVGESLQISFEEGIDTYNMEDGHFSFSEPINDSVVSSIEKKANLTIYDFEYFDEDIEGTYATVRVYKDRSAVNMPCIMEGEMPKADNEIVIDRLFARNNEIEIGDIIKLGGRELVLTGLAAFPDYSCLFESNADSMFDSTLFTPALMTEDGYDSVESAHVSYNYAWTYEENIPRSDKAAADKRSKELIDILEEVLIDANEAVVDEAIKAGKLVALRECLEKIEEQGMDPAMFDSDAGREMLLEQINKALEDEDIDLTEEFEEVLDNYPDKSAELTVEDLKLAMKASKEDVNAAQEYIDNIENEMLIVEDYLPRYMNQAINFGIDDVGSDSAVIILFGYIVVAVIAFVFAVTTNNTITAEAGVIGTLRASGYTKGEIVRHYMVLPVLVTFIAAIVGNVFGYTVMKKAMTAIEYNSFSFATYKTVWNADAFLLTTIVPIILMFVINLVVIANKLKLSPLRFLRRDLGKRGKKKAFRLNTKLPIMMRFRIRVIFQNIPNYIVLFLGIFLGGMLVIFGFMFGPLLDDYAKLVVESRIADYQYIVTNTEVSTENASAEKFAMTGLNTFDTKYKEEEISVFGIAKDSEYVSADIPAGKVVASNVMMDKFKLKNGDVIKLKADLNGTEYSFEIAEDYRYDAALALFMNIDDYRTIFNESEDYFTGFFSNEEITDIAADDIYTIITIDDLQKLSNQMKISMGNMMIFMRCFGVIMFVLIMYILSKQIIEKNANSIAMTKILGFKNGEIGGLYIVATSVVVFISLLLTIPLIHGALYVLMNEYLYVKIVGYIPFMIDKSCYIKMFLIGIATYAAISVFQLIKISRVPKVMALKTVE